MLTRRDFMKKSAAALGIAAAVPVVAASIEPEVTQEEGSQDTPTPQPGQIVYECQQCGYSLSVPTADVYDIRRYKIANTFMQSNLGWFIRKNPDICVCKECLGCHNGWAEAAARSRLVGL